MLKLSKNNSSNEAGFTLIEVLIASAILMASIGVLIQLFGSGLDRVNRSGKAAHLLLAQKQIVVQLTDLNFAEISAGKGNVEGFQYTWKTTILEGFVMPEQIARAMTAYALFTVTVTISMPGSRNYIFDIKRLGWKYVR